MSPCYHSQDGSLVVCTGTNRRYVIRVRAEGFRLYTVVGKPTRSLKVALRRMADAFASRNYKRADILFEQDWYEPVQVCELVRR